MGMQMSQTRFQVGAFEGVASSLRLLVAPLLAYGVGFILGLPRLEHQVLVLQSATPVAVNAFLLTREFGGEALRVARSVVVST
ncbi:AEC family transporter, partial [Acinetobacter baumannii]